MVTEFIWRPLLAAASVAVGRAVMWARAIAAAVVVFLLSMALTLFADDLLIGVVGVAPETYGLMFNGWLALTLLAMGVVGRAQLD